MRRNLVLLGIVALSLLAWPVLEGQEPTVVVPAVALKPVPRTSSTGTRDLSKLAPQQRHLYLSAKSGTEWLARVNKTDGRFLPGFLPALRVPTENDNYLHQAAAAFTLGRAGAFFQDERAVAIAKQSILTLLLETTVDPKTQARFTAAPEAFLNRVASAGWLTLAIHELPAPANDLLKNAEELTLYLRAQQGADGAFVFPTDDAAAKAAFIQNCTGPALHGLMRSNVHRSAPWKLDAVRKACATYHAWWRQNKNAPMIPEHTAAYAEAYLATKEPAFANCVFEMNDWLCTWQVTNVDPRRAHWAGGFQPWGDGKVQAAAPDVHSATAAGSLAEACRVARLAGDAERLERYRAALERSLLFLSTLQYTDANSQHFAEWYRQNVLLGGFYLSHQDGNLRLDYTQQAVAALVSYAQHVAELP